MKKIHNSEDVAAYALAIVYAASQKDVVFRIGVDDGAVIWLNHRPVFDSPQYSAYMTHAVAVTLQPGRNTILAKVINAKLGSYLQLLISDELADFVRAYAGQKKWHEATAAYQKALAADPEMNDVKVHIDRGQCLRRARPLQRRSLGIFSSHDCRAGQRRTSKASS